MNSVTREPQRKWWKTSGIISSAVASSSRVVVRASDIRAYTVLISLSCTPVDRYSRSGPTVASASSIAGSCRGSR